MSFLGKKPSELSPEDLELLKEAANALARCGDRLEKALRELREAEASLKEQFGRKASCHRDTGGQGIHAARPGPDQTLASEERAIREYEKAWKKAERARYMYIVQREAVGFRNHKFADAIYPLPPFRAPSCLVPDPAPDAPIPHPPRLEGPPSRIGNPGDPVTEPEHSKPVKGQPLYVPIR